MSERLLEIASDLEDEVKMLNATHPRARGIASRIAARIQWLREEADAIAPSASAAPRETDWDGTDEQAYAILEATAKDSIEQPISKPWPAGLCVWAAQLHVAVEGLGRLGDFLRRKRASPAVTTVTDEDVELLKRLDETMDEWTPAARSELGRVGRLELGPPGENQWVRLAYDTLAYMQAQLRLRRTKPAGRQSASGSGE